MGTGEALNEHVLGDAWPSIDVRLEMLEEAPEQPDAAPTAASESNVRRDTRARPPVTPAIVLTGGSSRNRRWIDISRRECG